MLISTHFRCLSIATFFCILISIGYSQEPIPEIGPAGEVKQLFSDFKFTEGPASDGKGNLYFTDIPESKIYLLDATGNLSVFTENSNHSNGLMFNAQGELVACEMDGQIVAWHLEKKSRRVLAETYEGHRFNAPNDLVIDRAGGIYFTDPHYRAPKPLPQGKMGVYYLSAEGDVTRLLSELTAPNGICLSRDEKTLYVFPSTLPTMHAYDITEPGKLGLGREFCRIKTPDGKSNGGCDGVTIDKLGNLYLTTDLGIQVYSSEGVPLGTIEVPEKPANVTFGGPEGKTLFITARTSLYAVPMLVEGHRFALPRE